jgi:hypothetical protein
MNIAKTLGILALSLSCAGAAHANVTITQSGKKLTLKGDDANDVIVLGSHANAGEIVVTLNNVHAGTFARVRDVAVKAGGGNDILAVNGIHIGGSLKVKMDAGVDSVFLSDEFDPKKRELLIGGSVEIVLGGQAGDVAQFNNLTNAGITVGRNVVVRGASQTSLNTGSSSHATETSDVRIAGNLVVRGAESAYANTTPPS